MPGRAELESAAAAAPADAASRPPPLPAAKRASSQGLRPRQPGLVLRLRRPEQRLPLPAARAGPAARPGRSHRAPLTTEVGSPQQEPRPAHTRENADYTRSRHPPGQRPTRIPSNSAGDADVPSPSLTAPLPKARSSHFHRSYRPLRRREISARRCLGNLGNMGELSGPSGVPRPGGPASSGFPRKAR